jgi:copper transport protein
MRTLLVAVVVALALAPAAGAHAFLTGATPTPGSSVEHAPARVVLRFDEGVSPAHIDVVRVGGASVVAGRPSQPRGRDDEIVVPLRPGLPDGGYVVHWGEVDRDDGHLISGAFSFAVGRGVIAPTVSGGSGSDFRVGDAVARALLLAGLLLGAGLALFDRLVARIGSRGELVSAAALVAAAAGAAWLLARQPGGLVTRFDRTALAGAIAAAAAAGLTLGAVRLRTLRPIAQTAAVCVLAVPTLLGHAVARGPSHLLSVPSDLLHLAGAALWIGGVVALVLFVPSAARGGAVRRFAPLAAAAVVVIAVTGVLRAIGELRSVSQLWSTSYGQSLLVKSALFVSLIALAAVARGRPGRAAITGEAILLLTVVATVGVLTGLRPGRDVPHAQAAPAAAPFVTGAQAGAYAVGVALSGSPGDIDARATVLSPGGPVSGLDVSIAVNGRARSGGACGAGCYRVGAHVAAPWSLAVVLRRRGAVVGRATLRAPSHWPAPSAAGTVEIAGRAFDRLKTLRVVSYLASTAAPGQTTDWTFKAPDELAGIEREGGAGAIVIGQRRWDRDSASARWVESPQPRLRQPQRPWPKRIVDAHVVATAVYRGRPVLIASFYDPLTPTWYRLVIDARTARTYTMDMIAPAHFMHEDYSDFNRKVTIAPPR